MSSSETGRAAGPPPDDAVPPEGFQFRSFTPGDFDRLCELDQTCFPEEVAYTPDEIAAGLMQPRTFCIVAEQTQRVEGFILLHYRREAGHVVTIDLHPSIRRRGVGAWLMDLGEQLLRERGVRRMALEVAVDNAGAIAFYEGRGYVRQRLLPRYYRNGTDAYRMEKPLTGMRR